jgi:ABC-type branched-subunit amino acid transport system permease subunit
MFEVLSFAALCIALLIKYDKDYQQWLIEANLNKETNEIVYLFFRFKRRERFIKFSYRGYIVLFITLLFFCITYRIDNTMLKPYIIILAVFFISVFILYNLTKRDWGKSKVSIKKGETPKFN